MFTIFDVDKFKKNLDQVNQNDRILYMVYQIECCPETKRSHVQGYVEFRLMTTLKQCKKVLMDDSAHLEKRRGTQSDAINYCTKEESRIEGPFILGEKAVQGKRNDLRKALDDAKSKIKINDIIDENPPLIRYYNQLEKYQRNSIEPRDRNEEVVVEVLVGEAGTGKTRYVHEKEEELYTVPDSNGDSTWFDGYLGEEAVLFDDFYGGIKYSMMLKLLDRYPIRVPVKGGYVQWKPKRIYITSNSLPSTWYPGINDKRALMRRIGEPRIFEVVGNTMATTDDDDDMIIPDAI